MQLQRTLTVVLTAVLAVGCTSVNVRPPQDIASLNNVCIVRNPRVIVADFIEVLQDGFDRHGIATAVVEQTNANACPVTLTYTAFKTWDMATYLHHAELRLWRDGRQIGSADYHLKGGGGLSLAKWGSTRSKMDPVIDQLLAGAPRTGQAPPAPYIPPTAPAPAPTTSAPTTAPGYYEPDPAKRCDACQRIGKP